MGIQSVALVPESLGLVARHRTVRLFHRSCRIDSSIKIRKAARIAVTTASLFAKIAGYRGVGKGRIRQHERVPKPLAHDRVVHSADGYESPRPRSIDP